MEEEERVVVMIRVGLEMVVYEGMGSEEISPFFTHTSKLDDGFDGKSLENVGDYITW